jgi:hypothetical protein
MDLTIHSPIRHDGVVLSQLSTATSLLFSTLPFKNESTNFNGNEVFKLYHVLIIEVTVSASNVFNKIQKNCVFWDEISCSSAKQYFRSNI